MSKKIFKWFQCDHIYSIPSPFPSAFPIKPKTLHPKKKEIWHLLHIYSINYRMEIYFFVFKYWLFSYYLTTLFLYMYALNFPSISVDYTFYTFILITIISYILFAAEILKFCIFFRCRRYYIFNNSLYLDGIEQKGMTFVIFPPFLFPPK